MSGWTRHEGRAVGLPRESVDTDQIIPARFMSTPRSEGYGKFLLHDLRWDADGRAREHPLEDGASLLVARRNFGSGSSREAAVYALHDFGFRVVAAPSFGDIFAGNAANNGLLPARIREEEAEAMLDALAAGSLPGRVDLVAGEIAVGDVTARFDLSQTWRLKLENGWDDIDLTLRHREEIKSFGAKHLVRHPGALPA